MDQPVASYQAARFGSPYRARHLHAGDDAADQRRISTLGQPLRQV
ncbi:MAG: hypothetical protein ACM3ML_15155 [Micromonosporaceae bacterium]